jgi:putative two-component system response regulator
VRHHHERLDGSGYPDGLAGDAIPMAAQIIAVVDVFDAITTVRPYRRTLGPVEASEQLEDEVKQGHLRPDLVREFAAMVREGQLPSEDADAVLRARFGHPRRG